jgi:hypothetical protein
VRRFGSALISSSYAETVRRRLARGLGGVLGLVLVVLLAVWLFGGLHLNTLDPRDRRRISDISDWYRRNLAGMAAAIRLPLRLLRQLERPAPVHFD